MSVDMVCTQLFRIPGLAMHKSVGQVNKYR